MKSPLISMFCSAPKLLAGLLGLASLCSAGSALAQARYSFSEDGAEVTDSKTGLVWQRCSAGQVWKEDKKEAKNTCTGAAASYSYQGAVKFVETKEGWRMPTSKELASLLDNSRNNPAIDTVAFPATASAWYWTLPPDEADATKPWGVGFSNGFIGPYDSKYYEAARLRLVK